MHRLLFLVVGAVQEEAAPKDLRLEILLFQGAIVEGKPSPGEPESESFGQ